MLQLEQMLKAQSLWTDIQPTDEAMSSTTPFACDTMAFEHWLQFIFLPKMHQLLDDKARLPTEISIVPMAQHVWQHNAEHTDLIHLLNKLDVLLNESR